MIDSFNELLFLNIKEYSCSTQRFCPSIGPPFRSCHTHPSLQLSMMICPVFHWGVTVPSRPRENGISFWPGVISPLDVRQSSARPDAPTAEKLRQQFGTTWNGLRRVYPVSAQLFLQCFVVFPSVFLEHAAVRARLFLRAPRRRNCWLFFEI